MELKNSYRDEVEKDVAEPKIAHEAQARTAPEGPRVLKPGDRVRALGLVYRVRKVTPRDFVLRLEKAS